MSYEIDTLTADCYEGTTCLINKFDIHDAAVLAEVEADITFAKTVEFENNPIKELQIIYERFLKRQSQRSKLWTGQKFRLK